MKYSYAMLILLLPLCLGGCEGKSSQSVSPAPSPPQAAKHNVQLEIEKPVFSLSPWKSDGSHMTSVKGRLLIDDLPVANGVLHPSNHTNPIITGKDGSFRLTVDQSLLSDIKLKVASLKQATVSGKSLSGEMEQELQAASATVSVYYPIRIKKVEPSRQDPSQVQVSGQIIPGKGNVVSYFQVDKYRLGGVVKDADGHPVKDAVVWFDRDDGEGFGKSTPTDEEGNYSIYYWPEDEDTHLSVTKGAKRYTLPEGKVFKMPENTSVEIDITLPRKGTVIEDKPPTLVSVTSAGAMYTGVLVGLNLPEDIPYTATIPDKHGDFTLTVSKKAWEQKPAFFETTASKFVKESLSWGDTLPANYIHPDEEDPKHIIPVL